MRAYEKTTDMKRISLLSSLMTLPLALGLGVACDLEKEDGMDTGAVEDDLDEDDLDEDEDEDDTAGTSAGSGTSADTGDDDGDSAADTGSDESDSDTTSAGTGDGDGDDESDSDTTSAGTGDGDGDDDSDSDTTTDGDTDDSAGTGEGGDASAIAIRHADLPELDPGKGGSSTGDPKDTIPGDAVHVIVSASGVKTCEQPYAGEPCGGNWSVSFLLMPSMLEPGEYNLFEEANGGFTFADEPYDDGECGWGGGSLDGVLVIESVDEDAIIGHIEGSDAFDFDADISFVAETCAG